MNIFFWVPAVCGRPNWGESNHLFLVHIVTTRQFQARQTAISGSEQSVCDNIHHLPIISINITLRSDKKKKKVSVIRVKSVSYVNNVYNRVSGESSILQNRGSLKTKYQNSSNVKGSYFNTVGWYPSGMQHLQQPFLSICKSSPRLSSRMFECPTAGVLIFVNGLSTFKKFLLRAASRLGQKQ